MLISVIITNYNYSRFIGKALRSLLNQSLSPCDYEIIVLDDNSNDVSMKLLEAYLDSIRLVRSDKREGTIALCNEAFRRTKGQFVVRVDADDYVNRKFLEIESLFLIENKGFDAVACDYYKVDNKDNRFERYDASIDPIACGVMFRKEVVEKGYIENTNIWEDRDFVTRLNVYHIPLPLYRYLQHEGEFDALTMNTEVEVGTFWNRTDDYVRGLSHWRDASRWEWEGEWEEVGMSGYEFLSLWLSEYYADFRGLTIVDYGCGGGAVARLLCRDFKHVYGIDISPATLEECQKQVGHNFTPVLIDANDPEEAFHIGRVDIFLSLAVFQHFPSKEYAERIAKLAYEMCDKFAFIQVRYDDGVPKYQSHSEQYEVNVHTFTSYRMSEFPGLCRRTGFNVLHSVRVPETHCQYVFLKKGGDVK